jgi:hypothetical protein
MTIQKMACIRVKRCMERYDVAQLQQFIERNIIGGGLGALVIG